MTNIKLRIRHPSGAEFEAEGPADLIISEKTAFLSTLTGPAAAAPEQQPRKAAEAAAPAQDDAGLWSRCVEIKETGLKLRVKHPEIKAEAAAIILIGAGRQLSGYQETSAIDLAKALKRSGYLPGRLDRLLAKPIKNGWLRASGTKRNRAYQATARGLEIAWLEARKLANNA